MLRLTPKLRKILKKPLGRLTNISDLVKEMDDDKCIICVGDETSKIALKAGLKPKVCVCDGNIQRNFVGIPDIVRDYAQAEGCEIIKVKNPASCLTSDVFDVMLKAVDCERNTVIWVDGEEDLVALAAIKLAPIGSMVLYGQPSEGLVVVNVDEGIKDNVEWILGEMK